VNISQELMKMFNDSNSFYYCPVGDLTSSVQRNSSQSQAEKSSDDLGSSCDRRAWQKADDRFFWNKPMLTDLILSKVCRRMVWIVIENVLFETYSNKNWILCLSVCMLISVCVCVCVCIYICYTYIYTYINK